MSLDFFNPLMLIGLAGVLLPVLVHLLSRKRYDVVDWGAMPFLELKRNVRRRFRLEELLLLLVRMMLVALLAFALARPWTRGGLFGGWDATVGRDVVVVIDGSYSMGRKGDNGTPHTAAIGWVRRLVDNLSPGDTVSLIDAREQVRAVIADPTSDLQLVRQELDQLPPPSGGSNLVEAVAQAVGVANRQAHPLREIIVLSDGQSYPWRPADRSAWTRVDVLRAEAAVAAHFWAIDVDGDGVGDQPNFGLDRLRPARELAVAGVPVRLRTTVRYFGNGASATRTVRMEVNGQRLVEQTRQIELDPGGEASVEFEYRFRSAGSHWVSVVLDDDLLPGDNRADAALTVVDALPVLLVDGDPHPDPTQSETFFARPALTAESNDAPWVRATVVPWDRMETFDLNEFRVVLLANVGRLTADRVASLEEYVAAGGGLIVALGDQVDSHVYNDLIYRNGHGLLPAGLSRIEEVQSGELRVGITESSLERSWLNGLYDETSDLTQARFTRWWKVITIAGQVKESGSQRQETSSMAAEDDRQFGGDSAHRDAVAAGEPSDDETRANGAEVIASLNTADPLLLSRRFGRGQVLLLTAPLDADWSTLPTKRDYVPLLHEMILSLATERAARNVVAGEPLELAVGGDFPIDAHVFRGPRGLEFPAKRSGDELRPVVRLDDTRLPGVYRLIPRQNGGENASTQNGPAEYFTVDFDRRESNLKPLDSAERALLTEGDRIAFVGAEFEAKPGTYQSDTRNEIWHVVLLIFSAVLVGELVLTRRLVKGGHVVIDHVPQPQLNQPAAAADDAAG